MKRVQSATPLNGLEPITNDNNFIELATFCHGKSNLWHVSDSNTLTNMPIFKRVIMAKDGISSYITCSCISSLPQGGTGSFCVFRRKRATTWHLAIVESFFYFNHDGTDKIHLFEWNGSVSSPGSPALYAATCWDLLDNMFRLILTNLYF